MLVIKILMFIYVMMLFGVYFNARKKQNKDRRMKNEWRLLSNNYH